MKTVFVTGAAGFIGSHLTDAYLRSGWNVIGIDDLSTGRRANLFAADQHANFEFVLGDVRDETLIAPMMARSDLAVHLAARIGVKLVIESPLKTLETNVKGTECVLRQATRRKIPVLVASTSEVYGLTTKFPSHEDDPITFGSPKIGRWSYACSKAYDEALALAHHRESGLAAIVVRLFNTVGPRQTGRYGMVVPRFVRQAMAGEPITVYGDGMQTRCFCHVREVVDGLARLASEPRATGEVVNLGNPQETSIIEVARKVIRATTSSSQIEYVSFDRAYADGFEEIMRRIPDIGKARDLIGFEPRLTIDDVIGDVMEEYRHQNVVRA